MGLSFTVEDFATPWVEDVIRTFPDFRRKALKSTGWMIQKEIKAGIKSGAPGGKRYRPLVGIKRGKLRGIRVMKKGKPGKPLGRLRLAIGYQYKDDGSVVVGWLSRSAVLWGSRQEKGYRRRVTSRMRHLWWVSGRTQKGKIRKKGVFLSHGKNEIETPARPTIGPMRQILVPRIPGYFNDKIEEYLEGDIEGQSYSGKKYKVFGKW